ncbi:MAG: sigma-54-dependent transcriptional regulator [Pseudomonadota bacterium]
MRLMIVGSLQSHMTQAGKIAIKRGAKVQHAEDIEQALGALRAGRGADVVMVDVKQNIAEFIAQLEKERFLMPVVACGIETDAKAAVNAIKAGAKEYIPLPPDAELIAAVLEAVTQEDTNMIANDPAMKAVVAMADQIAPSSATVLITGESGTGKEVMSSYIHRKSKRKNEKFISLNCAAIPENLLESELFGYEKGAFTGAVSRRIGKFEEASGGTLLLDEISEMHPSLQAKLLRAIQERVIDRIGGNKPVPVDIRLIATSNRNLEEAVKKGEFREDLYFRLNVINVALPPLRNRPGDILPLARMFADKFSEQNDLPRKEFSEAAIKKLEAYHWPGNIRELENTMHRTVLLSQQSEIEDTAIMLSDQAGSMAQTYADNIVAGTKDTTETPAEQAEPDKTAVPDEAAAPAKAPTDDNENDTDSVNAFVGKTVADVERELIISTLDHCLGNRTHAAKILGISIRTLRNKINQYSEQGVAVPGS